MKQIEQFLAMPEIPEDDLMDLEDIRMPGSCDWFTDRPAFQEWLSGSPRDSPMLFWAHAKPATGKSVLAGHIISTVDDFNYECSYYFFRHGDKVRSTPSGCLLSILWQMALRNQHVRQKLLSMIDRGVRYEQENAKSIWRKLMEPILTSQDLAQIQFWVIDALDECSEISTIFTILSKLTAALPIKVFISSRRTDEIVQGFISLGNILGIGKVSTAEIQAQDTSDAIAQYLESNKHKLHVDTGKQEDTLTSRILQRSQGCFLWVRLVLEELSTVWTMQQVEQVIEEVPQEMDLLYSRAVHQIVSRPAKSIAIARAIILWTLCAIRPMTVDELQAALGCGIGAMVQEPLEGIPSLCSQLIHVDKSGRVLMVHLTAKTFLQNRGLDSPLAICPVIGHQKIARTCLEYLISSDFKPPKGRPSGAKVKKRANEQKLPFVGYAAFNFAEHLRRTTSNNPFTTPLLFKLFQKNVFTWIETVATANSLNTLSRTANVVKNYIQRQSKYFPPLGEEVALLDMWAIDLPRLVARFGVNLVKQPSSIHWLIPPFCPDSSAVATVFGKPAKQIKVVGLENSGWDDRLACVDSLDTQAYAVAYGEGYFAIGFGTSITICHASTCQKWRNLDHGSSIWRLGFDATGDILVSCGRRDLKVWDIEANTLKYHFQVEHDILALSLASGANWLLIALKSGSLVRWSLVTGEIANESNWELGFEDEGAFRRPPLLAAFSPDEAVLAVAYRGRPIQIWDLEDNELRGYVGRETQDLGTLALGSNTSPSSLSFNHDDTISLLAVAYEDGDLCLFDYEELKLLNMIEANAQIICCSPDGTTLATGNAVGMVQLLEFETFQLLFRVNAADYGIRSLAFSSDNSRLLDVRGTQCNVWEPALPSAKTRKDDASSMAGPAPPRIVGMSDAEINITTMAIDDSGEFFFIGKSDGSVWLYTTVDGKSQRLLYRHGHQMSVTQMVWGGKKHILVTADVAGRSITYQLGKNGSIDFGSAHKILDIRADVVNKYAITHLLLNPTNELLLISTHKADSVWNLAAKIQVSRYEFQGYRPPFDWINNPADASERILLGTGGAAVWDWKMSLEKTNQSLLSLSLPKSLSGRRLSSVINVFDSKKIAVEVLGNPTDVATTPASTILLLDTFPFYHKVGNLVSSQAFEAICHDILHLIGTYDNRLVFLNKQLCICSVVRLLKTTVGGFETEGFRFVMHFFIPSDWYSQKRSLKTGVTTKGDIIFVRAEEVAVIKHGLVFEGDMREIWDTIAQG
jgi:WD40 repeat protein